MLCGLPLPVGRGADLFSDGVQRLAYKGSARNEHLLYTLLPGEANWF